MLMSTYTRSTCTFYTEKCSLVLDLYLLNWTTQAEDKVRPHLPASQEWPRD